MFVIQNNHGWRRFALLKSEYPAPSEYSPSSRYTFFMDWAADYSLVMEQLPGSSLSQAFEHLPFHTCTLIPNCFLLKFKFSPEWMSMLWMSGWVCYDMVCCLCLVGLCIFWIFQCFLSLLIYKNKFIMGEMKVPTPAINRTVLINST